VDKDFWLAKWHANEIAFHQARPHRSLGLYWSLLGLPPGARVFVPLAGKSPDLLWLAAAGLEVVGIELSSLAVEQFKSENAGPLLASIDLRCGDFFDLTPESLGPIAGIFDRASLVALPPAMRQRYVAQLARLSEPGTQTLLVTLEYDASRMAGPPHSVDAAEITALYGTTHLVESLERNEQLDDFPKFQARGLDRLAEVTYRLTRR
jgi:thiopurine S-methyltransferase